MMKHITLLAAACLCSISAFSTRYLVQTGAEGDAKWTRTLQDGEELIDLSVQSKNLNAVYKNQGDEYWLAGGEYTTTASMSFTGGSKIYGGFAGTETELSERATVEGGHAWEFKNATIITGNNTFPIFTCTAALANETVLDGVTVQNGSQSNGNGGGMMIRPNGYVRNCRFINNTASNQGGAILFNGGGTVENSYFSGNSAKLGGACHIAAISNITGCLFENNTAENGGAIRSQATDATIANCIIRNNTATTNGSGIFTQSSASANKIINCLIYGNQTKVAVYMRGADIINCTVDGGDVNSVYVTTAGGKIINSVFTTPVESALTTGVEFMNNAYASIKGNDEWTNSNNKEITNGEFGFTDAASGDYTLTSTSPLINAGTDVSADYALAATDLIGTARPQGTTYDLGAYEYVPGSDPGTGLQAASTNSFRYTTNGNLLHISGLTAGETIIIYNIAGSKVAERTVSESTMSIALQQGIYIVRAAGQTKKIILN